MKRSGAHCSDPWQQQQLLLAGELGCITAMMRPLLWLQHRACYCRAGNDPHPLDWIHHRLAAYNVCSKLCLHAFLFGFAWLCVRVCLIWWSLWWSLSKLQ